MFRTNTFGQRTLAKCEVISIKELVSSSCSSSISTILFDRPSSSPPPSQIACGGHSAVGEVTADSVAAVELPPLLAMTAALSAAAVPSSAVEFEQRHEVVADPEPTADFAFRLLICGRFGNQFLLLFQLHCWAIPELTSGAGSFSL